MTEVRISDSERTRMVKWIDLFRKDVNLCIILNNDISQNPRETIFQVEGTGLGVLAMAYFSTFRKRNHVMVRFFICHQGLHPEWDSNENSLDVKKRLSYFVRFECDSFFNESDIEWNRIEEGVRKFIRQGKVNRRRLESIGYVEKPNWPLVFERRFVINGTEFEFMVRRIHEHGRNYVKIHFYLINDKLKSDDYFAPEFRYIGSAYSRSSKILESVLSFEGDFPEKGFLGSYAQACDIDRISFLNTLSSHTRDLLITIPKLELEYR